MTEGIGPDLGEDGVVGGFALYPLPLGQRLRGSWFQFDFREFNESGWARKVPTASYGSIEVRPLWLDDAEAQA